MLNTQQWRIKLPNTYEGYKNHDGMVTANSFVMPLECVMNARLLSRVFHNTIITVDSPP